jgi:hypothetical protein
VVVSCVCVLVTSLSPDEHADAMRRRPDPQRAIMVRLRRRRRASLSEAMRVPGRLWWWVLAVFISSSCDASLGVRLGWCLVVYMVFS